MSQHVDLIIVGAGCFGMSTGYYASRLGLSVLLIDANDPPHSEGSHHGGTRLFRSAYTMGSEYVSLALQSRSLWLKLQQEAQVELFRQTGVVSVGHEHSSFLDSKKDSCRQFGIPSINMTAKELTERWEGLMIPSGMTGLLEPEAGVLFSEHIIETYRRLALANGAKLLTNVRVTGIEEGTNTRWVQTTEGVFKANSVLVASGALSASVLPELKDIIRPVRKTVGWFDVPNGLYNDPVFPAFVFNIGDDIEYYGIPDIGHEGLKLGRHDGGIPHIPGQSIIPFDRERDEAELTGFLSRFMPEVGSLIRGSACLYETAPDERFMIGPVPGRNRVWLAGGGSGHGFKFGSAIGWSLALQFSEQAEKPDLSSFYFI